MKNILLTLIFLASISLVNAQESRVVRLDESRENVISSEIIISNFDSDREIGSISINDIDLVLDTDSDGLSDFIETNVYYTDINKESTLDDSKIDMSKMLLGFDPLSEASLEVKYEDIRLDFDATILKELSINNVSYLSNKILLKGKGLPNSLTTIYIFDSGLVITVPTDENGNWEYLLAKEITDGEYDTYIGVLNTEGSVVAKGEMITFKQDNGEVIMSPRFEIKDFNIFNFLTEYFWWIILSIFIFGTLVVGLLMWRNTEVNEGRV